MGMMASSLIGIVRKNAIMVSISRSPPSVSSGEMRVAESFAGAASCWPCVTHDQDDRGHFAGKRTADDRPGQEVSSKIRQQRHAPRRRHDDIAMERYSTLCVGLRSIPDRQI
jgi:hypothetical protein